MVVYVTFLRDVACQKLLNSANVSRSYSQNNTGKDKKILQRANVGPAYHDHRRTIGGEGG